MFLRILISLSSFNKKILNWKGSLDRRFSGLFKNIYIYSFQEKLLKSYSMMSISEMILENLSKKFIIFFSIATEIWLTLVYRKKNSALEWAERAEYRTKNIFKIHQ